MRESMTDRIARLTCEFTQVNRQLAAAQAEIARLESGEELAAMRASRDRLAAFARVCIDWGSPDCRCGDRARLALVEAGVES